jgi:hypothetical protein
MPSGSGLTTRAGKSCRKSAELQSKPPGIHDRQGGSEVEHKPLIYWLIGGSRTCDSLGIVLVLVLEKPGNAPRTN